MSAEWTARSESNHPEDVAWCERQRWLAERRKGVGASEVAAILGIDPWKTALGVWASKVHGDEVIDSEAMEIGRLLEEPAAQMFAKRFPDIKVTQGSPYKIHRHPDAPLSATLDRGLSPHGFFSLDQLALLEIKASSRTDEWAAGPPLRYLCQVQAQLACTGYQWGYLAALLGGRKFVAHRIERDDAFIAKLLDKVRAFWTLVESRTEPPATQPFDLSVVKMLHPRDSGETVEASPEAASLADEWHLANQMRIDADKDAKRLEAQVRQALGGATWMALPDGRKVQARVEARKAELCKSCGCEVREASEPRVLRMVKPSKGRK